RGVENVNQACGKDDDYEPEDRGGDEKADRYPGRGLFGRDGGLRVRGDFGWGGRSDPGGGGPRSFLFDLDTDGNSSAQRYHVAVVEVCRLVDACPVELGTVTRAHIAHLERVAFAFDTEVIAGKAG